MKQRLVHPKQSLNELDTAFTKAIGTISLFGLKVMNKKDERKPDYFYERPGKTDEVFYVDIRKPIKSNAVYKMRNDGVSLQPMRTQTYLVSFKYTSKASNFKAFH